LDGAQANLTVGKIELRGGQRSDLQIHAGDESLFVVSGDVGVRVPA
jgi:quercetin dioxygenase-like cupin family protein